MLDRTLMRAVALGACLAVAGCGSGGKSSTDSQVSFKSGFAASQKAFRKLGTDLANDITKAGNKTDAQLAKEFDALATRAEQQAAALAALHPPGRYGKRVAGLVASFHAVNKDLSDIATAAARHSASRAEAATRALLSDAAQIKSADGSLSRALRLPVPSASRAPTTASSSP